MGKQLQTGAIWKQKYLAKEHFGEWPDCLYCGIPFCYADGRVDHIISRSAGGTSGHGNVVLCCVKCNKSKFNYNPRIWMLMKGYSLNDCRIILEQLGKDTDWLDIVVGAA